MRAREPFDDVDREIALRYLRDTNRHHYDPLEDNGPGKELFAASLVAARHHLLGAFKTKTKSGERFRAYPVYTRSLETNAFVKLIDGVHLCSMDIGLVLASMELALFALSQADILTEIGEPAKEVSGSLPENSYFGSRLSSARESRISGTNLAPRDGTRAAAALTLTHMMLRFAWQHEFSHAIFGHSNFLTTKPSSLELHEAHSFDSLAIAGREEASALEDTRTRQCMEFEADIAALLSTLSITQLDRDPFSFYPALPKDVLLKLAMLGCLLMTFTFEQSARLRGRVKKDTHPNAHIRLYNLISRAALPNLQTHMDIRTPLFSALAEVKVLRMRIPALSDSSSLPADLSMPSLQTALQEFEEDIVRLREVLEPLRYRL